MFHRLLIVLFSLCFLNLAFAQQREYSPPADNQAFYSKLQTLINAAQNNPTLKAADAKVQASAASAKAQKSLDPPQVAVEFYQAPVASFPDPFKNQMEYDYSIQQMLPFPGKLGAMANAENKQTDMLKADRKTTEQDIVRNVKSLYFDLYLKNRQIEINHETRMLVRGFVDIARKQYEVDMGKQSDILRAQTELSTLGNDSIVLVQERKSMEGMLNAVCNRPVSSEIGFIPEVNPVLPTFELDKLMALARKNRPELKSMETGIEMQEAERIAAKKGYLPDFMVRGMYKQMMQGGDDWSLMLGATVPIAPWSHGRISSETKRADANIRTAESDRENMINMISSEVNDALLKVESAKERLKLSRESVIPQAEQTLESALSAYRTGKQEFLMLIDIQRMLVMAKLDYHMAVMTLLDSQSRLERAVGLSTDEIDKEIERENK
ncbi:MAG: TolC family protein [Chitinivibrionales bacterium]